MFDLTLLIVILPQQCLSGAFLFYGVVGIISKEDRNPVLEHLDHLCHDPVKEIPVMRYDDDCPFIIHQIGFQPCDRIHIQVVGRLIEENDIRFCHQKTSQSDSGLLSAGKFRHFLVKIFLSKAESL